MLPHSLYNPARGRRRTVDYLHIWVGGSLQLAALINIFLGLAWGGAGTGYMVGYGLWFAAVMALYAFKFVRTTPSLQVSGIERAGFVGLPSFRRLG